MQRINRGISKKGHNSVKNQNNFLKLKFDNYMSHHAKLYADLATWKLLKVGQTHLKSWTHTLKLPPLIHLAPFKKCFPIFYFFLGEKIHLKFVLYYKPMLLFYRIVYNLSTKHKISDQPSVHINELLNYIKLTFIHSLVIYL